MKPLIAMLMTVFIVTGCATHPTQQQINSADYGTPPPSTYEQVIKERFQSTLFDPYSAQYTFAQPVKGYINSAPVYGTELTFGWQVCGSVNAKNRFGGFTGAAPFLAIFKDGGLKYLLVANNSNEIYDQIKRNGITSICG